MAKVTHWEVATATDIGGRNEQQDRVSVLASENGAAQLVIVADGMGRSHDGAEAAQRVVDTAARVFHGAGDGRQPRHLLEDVCLGAHEGIVAAGHQDQGPSGSTCALLYLSGSEAYWMHVGDSRLYHFSGDRVCSCTEDHSVAVLLARSRGHTGQPEGDGSGSNQLYMCLGGNNGVIPEFGASAITESDWFMLCTDGFWNRVTAKEAARLVHGPSSLSEAAVRLVDLARDRGGCAADNITLALVRSPPPRRPWLKLVRRRR